MSASFWLSLACLMLTLAVVFAMMCRDRVTLVEIYEDEGSAPVGSRDQDDKGLTFPEGNDGATGAEYVTLVLSREDAQALYDHTGTMPFAPDAWSHQVRSALSEALSAGDTAA
jgi:hypothetical protein